MVLSQSQTWYGDLFTIFRGWTLLPTRRLQVSMTNSMFQAREIVVGRWKMFSRISCTIYKKYVYDIDILFLVGNQQEECFLLRKY